jgi:UPF0755 protein
MGALSAAIRPAKTDYLYFVADDSGGHVFSRTFPEHLQAIASVRRLRAQAQEPPPPAETPAADSGTPFP